MSKLVKKLLADQLSKSFAGVSDLVVLSVGGLDGKENNSMRLALHGKDIRLQVLHNRLAKRVFEELGLQSVIQSLEGPTAVAWGGPSIVELAKEISTWAEKLKKIEIKGGTTSGLFLTPEQIKELSRIPSREELLAGVVHLAQGPGRMVRSRLEAPAARIAGQLKAKSEEGAVQAGPAEG